MGEHEDAEDKEKTNAKEQQPLPRGPGRPPKHHKGIPGCNGSGVDAVVQVPGKSRHPTEDSIEERGKEKEKEDENRKEKETQKEKEKGLLESLEGLESLLQEEENRTEKETEKEKEKEKEKKKALGKEEKAQE